MRDCDNLGHLRRILLRGNIGSGPRRTYYRMEAATYGRKKVRMAVKWDTYRCRLEGLGDPSKRVGSR
jgi:hypothetical protein